jgi:hypothetical protein
MDNELDGGEGYGEQKESDENDGNSNENVKIDKKNDGAMQGGSVWWVWESR